MHWFASDELIQDELRVRMLQNSVPLASGPPQDAMKVFLRLRSSPDFAGHMICEAPDGF